jgi:anti-sigma-K factor RskA
VEHVDELIPAHALRSLDPADEQAVEAHLAGCERCRLQLAEFESVAATLAYAAPAAAPPPDLRARVLGAVEPVVEAPPVTLEAAASPAQRMAWRWSWPRIAAVAAPVFAALALALGIWNISLRNDLDSTKTQLADGSVVHLGNVGNVVAHGGKATLYADLKPAPPGKVYEAWVIRDGKPIPAGAFDGGGRTELDLTAPVKQGDQVAITVEPAPGVDQPTSKPIAAGQV